jgi:hypothetical protein
MSTITITLVLGLLSLFASPLFAQQVQPPQAQSEATIPPGTSLPRPTGRNTSNSSATAEIYLWQGTGFWKMPPDVRIEVGPTTVYPVPAPFVEATENYGSQTRLEK